MAQVSEAVLARGPQDLVPLRLGEAVGGNPSDGWTIC